MKQRENEVLSSVSFNSALEFLYIMYKLSFGRLHMFKQIMHSIAN